jgi:hypothetical protein
VQEVDGHGRQHALTVHNGVSRAPLKKSSIQSSKREIPQRSQRHRLNKGIAHRLNC